MAPRDTAPRGTATGDAVSRPSAAATTGPLIGAHLAFSVAEFGAWFAVLVFAYDRGGAAESGLVAALQLIPAGLLAPVLAHVSRRMHAGRMLVGALAAQAALCTALAVLLGASAPPVLVYGVAVVLTVSFTLVRPTESAVLLEICRDRRHLSTTNTFMGFAESVGMLGGPAVVAMATAWASVAHLFVAMAVMMAAAALANVRLVRTAPDATQRPLLCLSDDVSTEPADAGGRARMVALLVGLRGALIGTCDLLLLSVAVEFMHVADHEQTTLNIAFGIGLVVGSVCQLRLVRIDSHAAVMIVSSIMFGVALAVLILPLGGPLTIAVTGIAGVGAMTGQISGQTLLQTVAPRGTVSTMFGIVESATLFGGALGTLAVAGLISLVGLSVTLGLAAVILPAAHLATRSRLRSCQGARSVVPVQPRNPSNTPVMPVG